MLDLLLLFFGLTIGLVMLLFGISFLIEKEGKLNLGGALLTCLGVVIVAKLL